MTARLTPTPLLRRLALALVAVVPLLATAAAVPAASAQDDIVVTMVTDTAGLGDQNFNDAVRDGLSEAEENLGVTVRVLESVEQADFVPNLEAGAADSDLTIGVGFLLQDAIIDVATRSPEAQFMFIDGVAAVDGEPLENVASVIFREEEGGFLAGVIAALTTQTGKVGILGGQDIPPVERYEVGFRAGVEAAAPEVEVAITYADTFEDPALGRELSLALYNDDVDIVFAIAGETGVGPFQAASEFGGDVYVIAADKDQSQLGAEFQLGVATKSLAAAVYTATEGVVEGGFEGGIQDVGVAEDGTGFEVTSDQVPAEAEALAEQYRQAILDGTLTVPSTRDELESFEAPALGSPAAGTPAA